MYDIGILIAGCKIRLFLKKVNFEKCIYNNLKRTSSFYRKNVLLDS